MHSSDFSTANVSSRECFSYWREAVCQAILQVDAEVESRHGFKAAISGAVVGGAKLASFEFEAAPHHSNEIARQQVRRGRLYRQLAEGR